MTNKNILYTFFTKNQYNLNILIANKKCIENIFKLGTHCLIYLKILAVKDLEYITAGRGNNHEWKRKLY